jgi:hypothetical protein
LRLQNNPSIAWVHPKFTNAHPLAWGNKNCIHETWSENKNCMSNATHTPPPNYYSKKNVTVIFQNPGKTNSQQTPCLYPNKNNNNNKLLIFLFSP